MEGRLRKLKGKDAVLMLEWMHDRDVVEYLSADFGKKTLDDCKKFIEESLSEEKDVHLAIADEEDTYMGTVSLKHLDRVKKTAEFAITVRSEAMGKGYAASGMRQILKEGISRFGLERIYWCVSIHNKRAIRFYEKNGYEKTAEVPVHIKENYSEKQLEEFIWFLYQG